MMKENKEFLQENTSNRLFEEKFDEKMVEFVKLKRNQPNYTMSRTTKLNRPSISKPELVSTNGPPTRIKWKNYFQGNQCQVQTTELVSNFLFIKNNFGTNFVRSEISKCPPTSEKPVSSILWNKIEGYETDPHCNPDFMNCLDQSI